MTKKLYKQRSGTLSKAVLIVVLFCCIILPLIKMFACIGSVDLGRLYTSPRFFAGFKNSLLSSSVATLISLAVSFMLAWCVSRTNIHFKEFFSIFLVIPMLIPSISHSTGLIMLLGKNGIITNILGLSGNIYGFWGIVFGSVLYSFPFGFLMILDILKYEDSAPYEAANILGIPRINQIISITLRYLRKPMISVVFATFTCIFTDYGVPLAIGGKYTTLPVIMYQEVIGQLDFGKGSAIGIVLLIPAVVAFIVDVTNKDKAGNSYVSAEYKVTKNPIRDKVAYIVCSLTTVSIGTIIFSFAVLAFTRKYPIDLTLTFSNVLKTFEMNGGQYLINSLVIAALVTAIGVTVGFITAYMTARMVSKLSKALHLIAMTSLAIPGIVLGLAYALLFKGSFIYGTLFILVIVNTVHFTASPYLMMYNTLGKLNENLENVGQTLGVSRIRIIINVIIPQVKSTLIEMGSYLFVNSMITISAVSFLATTSNKPFSLMINQFEALFLLECSAVVSLMLLVINIAVKGFVYLAKRKISSKEHKNYARENEID